MFKRTENKEQNVVELTDMETWDYVIGMLTGI